MTNILSISASGRHTESVSRHLADKLIARIVAAHKGAKLVTRDVSSGMTFPTDESIGAGYTPPEARTPDQKKLLAFSDTLTDEVLASDILVLSTPMYNFGTPAALKAWFDLIVRVGKTFRFNEQGGYVPLAGDRKTYVIITAGGVPMGSPVDHLTPLIQTIFGFIGITSIEFIYVAGTNMPQADDVIAAAEQRIASLPV